MFQQKMLYGGMVCLLLYSTLRGAQPEPTPTPSINLRRLELTPVPEAREALKHRLLPRTYELKHTNAALLYQSAVAVCPEAGEEKIFDKVSEWLDQPVSQLPRDEVDKVLQKFRNSFHLIERASLRSRCEWDMPIEDGFAMLMPSLATYRKLAFAMTLRFRLEVADGRLDEALDTLTEGLAMARGVANGPTLIQDLVGVAIAAMMLKHTGDFIQTPGTPNLYWALTDLPVPLIDLRQSLDYEYYLMYWEVPELRALGDQVLSQTQAAELIAKLFKKFSEAGLWDASNDKSILPMVWVMMHYENAKAFLLERGMQPSRIEALPSAQVVLMYQFQEFKELRDNLFKWFSLPYQQYRRFSQQYEQRIDEHLQERGHKANIFVTYLPALSRVRLLGARLCRDIDLLRVIEALRLHTADHQGKLPPSLDTITRVPIPRDPVTGKAFVYLFKDASHARLEAPETDEDTKKRPVFELSIRP